MQDEVKQLILSIPELILPTDGATQMGNPTSEIEVTDGERFLVTSVDKTLTQSSDSPLAFQLFDQVLFPGSIVQGQILTGGPLAQISLPRSPGTIVLTDLSLGGTAPQFSREIPDPELSTVEQARQELTTQQMVTGEPAEADFVAFQYFSAEHALVQVGARVEWLTGEARANLSQMTDSTRTNFVASFTQAYYKIAFQAPVPLANVFSDDVTSSDLQPFVQQNNPPLYVGEVTYGRRILYMASSQESAEKLNVALSAAFTGLGAQGNVQVNDEQSNVLKESEIRALILGGPAGPAVEIFPSGEEKKDPLSDLISQGKVFSPSSPGVPISFQLNYLRSNQVAKVSFTTGPFTERTRTPMPFTTQEVHITLLTTDDDKDDDLTAFVEILGPDGAILASGAFGQKQTWGDHSSTTLPPFPLAHPVNMDDVPKMRLRVSINNTGDGWGTSYNIAVKRFEDGTIFRIGSDPKPDRHLGDGDTLIRDDPFDL